MRYGNRIRIDANNNALDAARSAFRDPDRIKPGDVVAFLRDDLTPTGRIGLVTEVLHSLNHGSARVAENVRLTRKPKTFTPGWGDDTQPNPNETIEFVRRLKVITVAGNIIERGGFLASATK